ncbi:DUF2927 domain-containing protein [Oceanicola sp. S124]|uniref:DUF2927 domain-containing protein n=1 Tax=Oceanicola sp. S124 TaxID=1042378 RepID=UPI000A02C785|nr:DUF2927 domain-containing protein [Oceanicola sp. S124]
MAAWLSATPRRKRPGTVVRKARRLLPALLVPLVLAGCAELLAPSGPPRESLRPVPRTLSSPPPEVSAESRALAARYRAELARDLSRNRMRQDGGRDVTFDAADLARNFEKIAFYDEYPRGAALPSGAAAPGRLLRWEDPVRLRPVFGASVAEEARAEDRAVLRPLARSTGHPIQMTGSAVNFHVLVMGEADRDEALSLIGRLVPGLSAGTLATLRNLPRNIPCLVMGFADPTAPMRYGSAIALVRAELPPLMREACFHEEIAQGLGLRNDSPEARPSIFNDDAEFALLTGQDDLMLQMLYDARLRTGMTLAEARPVIARIAAELRPAPADATLVPASAEGSPKPAASAP